MRLLLAALFLLPLPAFADSLAFSEIILGPLSIQTQGLTDVEFRYGSIPADVAPIVASLDQEGVKRVHGSTRTTFWIWAEGNGYVTASIPYTLRVNCVAAENPADEHKAQATLTMNTLGASKAETLACGSGESLERSGVLSLSRVLDDPWWGPLLGFTATGTSEAVVVVPESPWLLVAGLTVLVAGSIRRGSLRRFVEGKRFQ